MGNNYNKIVKFEIPNFGRLRQTKEGGVNKGRNSHVQSKGDLIYGNLHKIGVNINSKLAVAHLL